MVDYFGNVPDLVIDKILVKLPIRMAAQTSVLSKQWRRAWLSRNILSFNRNFWEEQKDSDWQKCSQIISNILLYHDGPVHKFNLHIPFDTPKDCTSYSQWISFLSKNGVREICIENKYSEMDITSYIFRCSELVFLFLQKGSLNPPPTDFTGFPNLRNIMLFNVHFKKPNVFRVLIENCKMLEELQLLSCLGIDHVILDLPHLQTFILIGDFESLAFRNVRSLRSLTLLSLRTSTMPENLLTVKTFEHLANSCQLQSITFDDHLFELFAASGIKRSSSITFNHLHELYLRGLSLSDFGVFRDVLSMIECCPYIKKLEISVIAGEMVSQDTLDFNYNYKLEHLREVIIEDLTGSTAGFKLVKLVEYLLAISTVLENLFIKYGKRGIASEPNMLMGFPRASPKARLLFLDK